MTDTAVVVIEGAAPGSPAAVVIAGYGPQGPVGPQGPSGGAGPQGPVGPQGTAGQSFTWRGVYASGSTYALDDAVMASDGSSYISLQNANVGHDPTVSPLWWSQSVIHGAVGPAGPTGATGATGATGPTGPQGNPTTVNGHTGAVITLTAADVGADASGLAAAETTRAQTAEALLIPLAQKAATGGVGTLDNTGRQPIAQAPLSVDTVSSPKYAQVYAPYATGVAATDTANLLDAIARTPAGGSLFISNPARGGQTKYMTTAPLVFPQNITVRGESLTELWASRTSGVSSDLGPGSGVTGGAGCTVGSAAFAGVVIEQQTAATDVIQCPTAATTVNLENICASFAAAIRDVNTGHGFNCTPTQAYSTGLDDGLMGATWRNCTSAGHDGNHYGFTWTNFVLCQFYHLRSYGGGGFSFATNSTYTSYGNSTLAHPYAFVYNVGTADGFTWNTPTLGYPGGLGLCTIVNPQAIAHNAVKTAATQKGWNDNGGAAYPTNNSIAGILDLENFASNAVNLNGTVITPGANYVTSTTLGPTNSATSNTWLGVGALGAATTGGQHVAVGVGALAAVTTGAGSTALGFQAGNAMTGNSGVFVGWKAGLVNTANSSVFVGQTAGLANTTGANNTIVGAGAFAGNVTGGFNVAMGYQALAAAGGTAIAQTTAIGYRALASLTTGTGNTALGYNALNAITTTASNTGVGYGVLQAAACATVQCTGVGNLALGVATTSTSSTAVGVSALGALTTGNSNVGVGVNAGQAPAGVAGNATVTGQNNTFVGTQTGMSSASDFSNQTALGYRALVNGTYALALGTLASAGAAGAVAIGTDNAGTGASTTTANVIALGTALHSVQLKNNSTGAGSALLGANCPAVTITAPYTWFKMMSSDGSAVYVPAWK